MWFLFQLYCINVLHVGVQFFQRPRLGKVTIIKVGGGGGYKCYGGKMDICNKENRHYLGRKWQIL